MQNESPINRARYEHICPCSPHVHACSECLSWSCSRVWSLLLGCHDTFLEKAKSSLLWRPYSQSAFFWDFVCFMYMWSELLVFNVKFIYAPCERRVHTCDSWIYALHLACNISFIYRRRTGSKRARVLFIHRRRTESTRARVLMPRAHMQSFSPQVRHLDETHRWDVIAKKRFIYYRGNTWLHGSLVLIRFHF